MDALRRAEEAKRLANPSSQPDPVASLDLTLAPLEPPSQPRVRSLPPLSRHLDSVDADLASEAGTAPPGRNTARPGTPPTNHATREAAERTAAKNVFAVKQPPRSRTSLWLFLGLGGLAMLAIGGYFWWQLQSLSNASLVVATPPMQPTNPSPVPGLAATVAATRVPTTPAPQPLPTSSPEAPHPPPSPRAAAPVSSPARVQAASSLPRQEAALFRASNSRARQGQTLDQAYEAWQANQLDDARRGYEQVLRTDPWNTDALLGLAAIAARQGQTERAQELYLRVLEADPGDVTAQAALVSLRSHGDTGQSESRLKTLLARQPDASALHFALGNLYARQGRWSEAQQAYFQAYALEPDNGDYLFNVAVSLDHLRQSKLAAQYYRMALSAAETRRSAFNADAAGRRILELQP